MTNINKTVKMMEGMSKESKIYWVYAMVNLKELSKSEAGYIILSEKL
jgi:hypothetical protein